MTKAKTPTRQALLIEPDDDLMLPETWRRRPWIPFVIVVAILAVVVGAGLGMNKALQPAVPSALANCKTAAVLAPHEYSGRQPICIVPNKKYTATLNTTAGQIVIELLPQYAPVTVNNFVVLAVNGYYDGLAFWDAADWEVQGGDPQGNGQGGPGYNLPEEPADIAWAPGAVGMARVPGGPINGSQFFIAKTEWPNGGATQVYNRFGTVTQGLDRVSAIAPGDRINTVTISVSSITASPAR